MTKNIALIRFSSRDLGNSTAIGRYIRKYYEKECVQEFILDANTVQPCNNCNYECLLPGEICPNLDEKQKFVMDAIIISNTEGDNFKNAMMQQVSGQPVMLYMKTGKYKKRSTAGDIMDSEDAQADLRAFLDAYPD